MKGECWKLRGQNWTELCPRVDGYIWYPFFRKIKERTRPNLGTYRTATYEQDIYGIRLLVIWVRAILRLTWLDLKTRSGHLKYCQIHCSPEWRFVLPTKETQGSNQGFWENVTTFNQLPGQGIVFLTCRLIIMTPRLFPFLMVSNSGFLFSSLSSVKGTRLWKELFENLAILMPKMRADNTYPPRSQSKTIAWLSGGEEEEEKEARERKTEITESTLRSKSHWNCDKIEG